MVALALSVCLFGIPSYGQDGDLMIDISGDHRQLFEYLANPFRPGRVSDEAQISMRTRVDVRLRKGALELGVELNDARVYGTADPRNVTAAMVNAVEPLQYFVRYHFSGPKRGGRSGHVQAGRFTYDLGSRRIIGRQKYRNSINSFMGVAAKFETRAGSQVDAFWLYPSRIQPADQAGLTSNRVSHDEFDPDLRFAGVFLGTDQLVQDVTLRSYFVDLREQDDSGEQETRDRRLHTVGLQAQRRRKAGALDFDLEGAWQWGRARATASPLDLTDLSVRAWFLHAEVGYSVPGDHDGTFNLALTYDFASGDKDPADGRFNRYDPLFGPIRGDVGPTGLFTLVHRNNISAPGVRALWSPKADISVMAHWQAIWLDSATDVFGRLGVRDTSGASGSFTGHQVQMKAKAPIIKNRLNFEVGAVRYLNGRFFKEAPNAARQGSPFFLYSMATLPF